MNGLRHGIGNFYCARSNTSYFGHWFQGERHGEGRLVYDSSETSYYNGQWGKNMKEGYGVEQYR